MPYTHSYEKCVCASVREVLSKDFSNKVLIPMAIHWFDFGLKLGIDETQLYAS